MSKAVVVFERRPLGDTGVHVSVLGYGAMELRGDQKTRFPRPLTPSQAQRVVNAALDCGINFFDTSIDYGDSEENLGRALGARRRDIILATKCGCPRDSDQHLDPNVKRLRHDFGAENIRVGIEQSLRRLRTDYVDILQFHITPARAQLEKDDAVATLLTLRDEGKVRFIGCSTEIPMMAEHIAMNVFDTFQVPYSVLRPEHADLMQAANAQGAGVIVRGGLARGSAQGPFSSDQNWELWDRAGLNDLVGEFSATQLVLQATVRNSSVSTVIAGTASVDHLLENVRAVNGIRPEMMDEIRQRLKQVRAAEQEHC